MSKQVKDRKYWRDLVSQKIRSGVVNSLLTLITKSWAVLNVGPLKWMVEQLFIIIWNNSGDKIVRFVMRLGGLAVDKSQGKLRISKIEKAKDEDDFDEYRDIISDI